MPHSYANTWKWRMTLFEKLPKQANSASGILSKFIKHYPWTEIGCPIMKKYFRSYCLRLFPSHSENERNWNHCLRSVLPWYFDCVRAARHSPTRYRRRVVETMKTSRRSSQNERAPGKRPPIKKLLARVVSRVLKTFVQSSSLRHVVVVIVLWNGWHLPGWLSSEVGFISDIFWFHAEKSPLRG